MNLFSDDDDVSLEGPSKPESSDDLDSFLDFTGASDEKTSLRKPWMKFHRFVLVKTVEEVAKIVDDAIAHGRCALDLETEGFDNRIDYDEENRPSTRHQIVGYCLSVKGVGYYVPVKHLFNPKMGERDPNVKGAEQEIRRLLWATRPDVEGEPFIHTNVPRPKVVVFFWNSKFDQEFLYPITGIDIWHPSCFEDGMLAAYSIYSDDDLGLKVNAKRRLSVKDGEEDLPYEMIEIKELFPKGTKKDELKFKELYPEDGSDVVLYACSDAICTELLCEEEDVKWEFTQPNVKYSFKNVVKPAKEKHDFTYRLEKRAVQGVRDMERRRVLGDIKEVQELLVRANQEQERYRTLIVDLASKHGFEDFNPGSPQQLSDFLFEKNGLNLSPKPEKTASGQYQTDAATLESLAEDSDAPKVLEWIVKHRQVEKIIGTYLQNMVSNCDELGQMRFKFNQTGAATGRFTASSGEASHGYAGIPIQGIPARDDPKKPEVAQSLRRAFVARTGYTLVKIDYAGQELRIVSNISKEPKWVDEFLTAKAEGREADLHTLTAKAFFGDHITKENKKERAMGKCVHPDTLVCTPEGYRTFISLGTYPEVEDTFGPAPDGLKVYNGTEYVEVKSLYNGGQKPLLHVVTSDSVLTCSHEHRFKMQDGTLKTADTLEVGDALQSVASLLDSKGSLLEYNSLLEVADSTSFQYVFRTHDYVKAGKVATLLRSQHYFFELKVLEDARLEIKLDEASSLNLRVGTPCSRWSQHKNPVVQAVVSAGVQQCLDIELTTEDHLYVANGVLTHNTANFALIYGGGTGAIMRATKCDKVEAARRKANFDKSVPVFAQWVKSQHAFVKKHKGVYTAFKRFMAIPDAGLNVGDTDSYGKTVQEQDVNKIRAACERKSTNYPIQGSGADIMKLSLSFLLKEFLIRGWRREGGDDSVRVLMTVHDELVFEIKHERLLEALPIIIHHMESPSTLANWTIPLVVEPLLGLSWEAKHDWFKILQGKEEVPEWLVDHIKPGVPFVPKEKSSTPPPKALPSSASNVSASSPATPSPAPKSVTGTVRVATFVLGREDIMTEKSVRVVWGAVSGAVDPDSGIYLRLVTRDNDLLLDINDRFFIVPEVLQTNLNDRLAGTVYHEVKEEAV